MVVYFVIIVMASDSLCSYDMYMYMLIIVYNITEQLNEYMLLSNFIHLFFKLTERYSNYNFTTTMYIRKYELLFSGLG